MRSLSIGSPLLSTIRKAGCLSSSGGSMFGMTPQETRVLSELAPRVWSGHSTQLAGCSVTVTVFTCPVTSGDLVVKTTCLTTDGQGRQQQLIEFSRASASRLSQLLSGLPMERKNGAQLYRVSTSQPTTAQALRPKRALSFDGCLPDLSLV